MLGGKYRFSERLAQFAAVELSSAVDDTSGRAVTLERLALSAAVPDALQKLRVRVAEAQRMPHDGLLAVLDSFEHAGALYVVSEAVSGESLAARLTREEVTVTQLSTWLAGAMRAVIKLHRSGLALGTVHPAAIWLSEADESTLVKLAPLWLTSVTASPISDAELGYRSMEQLAGATDVDARSDVYAFAAIAYRALTGRLPFEADTPAATRLRIMTESATPLKRMRAELPDEICTLIDLALAKRREERLSSLESMLALLEPCAQQIGSRKVQLMTAQLPLEAALTAAAAQRPARMRTGPVGDVHTQHAESAHATQPTLLAITPTRTASPSLPSATTAQPVFEPEHAMQPTLLAIAPTGAAQNSLPSTPTLQTSLQPVDRPIKSAVPQPSAAKSAGIRGLTQRGPQIAAGTLALMLLGGWALSHRGTPGTHAAGRPGLAQDAALSGVENPAAVRCGGQACANAQAPSSTGAPTITASSTPSTAPSITSPSDSSQQRTDTGAAAREDQTNAPSAERARPAAKRASSARSRKTSLATPAAPVPAKARPECSPNYVFDAQGVKHWKPECF